MINKFEMASLGNCKGQDGQTHTCAASKTSSWMSSFKGIQKPKFIWHLDGVQLHNRWLIFEPKTFHQFCFLS